MALPEALQQAIETETAAIAEPLLAQASAELGRQYRGSRLRLTGTAAHAAYLAARMPAIFEVNRLLCLELARRCPGIDVGGVLDLGCGPATAALAAREVFGPLQALTLLDADREWFEIAPRLLAAVDPELAAIARMQPGDLAGRGGLPPHDLAIVSYALGELEMNAAQSVVSRAWECARRALIVVEPGTPRGFDAILAARDVLIAARAHIAAPCPHAGPCPLAGRDWCHFDTRVERSRRQQRLKAGSLSYEIEKYSYVIAVRQSPALEPDAARIIRHPLRRSGHVILDLCTPGARERRVVISRRDAESYRRARAARWGGSWSG